MLRFGMFSGALFLVASIASAQAPAPQPVSPQPPAQADAFHRSAYVLGPDDQIMVQVPDLEEIKNDKQTDRPIRVDMQGDIRLPIVGRLHVAGLTVEQTEAELRKRLSVVLKDPEVTVSVVEFRSHPVSVLGAVKTPGVVQLTSKKSLSEVLSMAGGMNLDAGNSVVITRRKEAGPLPLPGAHPDPAGLFYIGQVNLKSLMEGTNPQDNIGIESGDVISVPKGELVYVMGAVTKAGGFVLNERGAITVLQAISMAGGFDKYANQKGIEILRPKAGAEDRENIVVDVKAMLTGKANDVPLLANDILWVPLSGKKAATVRAIEAMIQIGSGVAIYRP